MLKYVNAMVTFSEVPDEISLCIEISIVLVSVSIVIHLI